MAIIVTDVVSQYGAFYKPGSDNEKNLRNMLYKPSETARFFQLRPTEDTIWRGTSASLSRVLQPFQKSFTPISNITFKPNQFDLFKLKVDLQETPDDLEATYLGFLANTPEQDRSKWPFVRWWLEVHVMPKKEEDLEVNEIFTGEFAAPIPGTAGAAGTAMNGLRKVIRGYNTAGRTNLGNGAIVNGAVPTDEVDFCTYVEEFVEAIPSIFRSKLDYIFMSKDLVTRYRKGKRKKYGLQVNFLSGTGVSDLVTIEDYTFITVQGLESMTGSNMIWASIASNRINPKKKASAANTMLVQQFAPRVVSAYSDWWDAYNFEVPEFIFHNDQDLA